MVGPIDRKRLHETDGGSPRYKRIAAAFESAIAAGVLVPGERLPPVRGLAKDLTVSGGTVAAAYDLLDRRGWTRGEVGRGTFVVGPPTVGTERGREGGRGDGAVHPPMLRDASPWRRRALAISSERLQAAHPDAVDCSSGKPDAALLPLTVMRRAWTVAVAKTGPSDLQYAGPGPVDVLARELVPRLDMDGVEARTSDLLVGSSAQQFMVLGMAVAKERWAGTEFTVAVEEPGYQTAFDTFERAGYRLIGVEVDAHGAVPASLAAALAAGASAALFIPRAHNPTGASWSARRRADLADVLAAYPGVVAVEDDQFAGLAAARTGSLLSDRRIADRVVHIRSFAKAIAPDLRLAVAVARPRLRALLADAKSFADGWSSRLAQRALARALADEELETVLVTARDAYAARRAAVLDALGAGWASFAGGATGTDGVNVWIHLPHGTDAADVIEQAAAQGVLFAPGEPFYIRPGHSSAVRISIGGVDVAQAAEAGRTLAATALTAASSQPAAMWV